MAEHYRQLADEYFQRAEEKEKTLDGVALLMTDMGRAELRRTEARGLEFGYLHGRIRAAYDVRLGLDAVFGNGGVHFDSDVEPPPLWLIRAAERLARGDAA